MSIERAKTYFKTFGMEDRILNLMFPVPPSNWLLRLCPVNQPTLQNLFLFKIEDRTLLILVAGDAKIDNKKYKAAFGAKAKMLSPDEVVERIGHAIGGVCPFGINEGVEVYLDDSMKRFDYMYPAAGSSNSAIKLTIPELEQYSGYKAWVDVCKIP